MAVGIWTPVEGSTLFKSFDIIRGTFADKKFNFAPVAGTHMMIQPMGCQPVFVSIAEPLTAAAGFTGIVVPPNCQFVMPRQASFWVFCPYESQVVHVTVGAMT